MLMNKLLENDSKILKIKLLSIYLKISFTEIANSGKTGAAEHNNNEFRQILEIKDEFHNFESNLFQ